MDADRKTYYAGSNKKTAQKNCCGHCFRLTIRLRALDISTLTDPSESV